MLIDFCPECAEKSLTRSRKKSSRISVCSASMDRVRQGSLDRRTGSVGSGWSGKSSGSSSTYIDRMPYVDYEGSLGHYTGHVTNQGHPNGRGKINYIDGSKYEGLFHEGTKVHGRKSVPTARQGRSGTLPLPLRERSRARNEYR